MAYVTVTELKDYADFQTSTDDALLDDLIGRAEQIIDTLTGRTFAASVVSARNLDAVADVSGAYLYLDEDCAEITAIYNGDGNLLGSDVYVLEPRNDSPIYAVKLLGSSNTYWTYSADPEDAITISGYWGFSKEAPLDIQQACLRLANWLYLQRETSVDLDRPLMTDGGFVVMPANLPNDVSAILSNYRKVTIL